MNNKSVEIINKVAIELKFETSLPAFARSILFSQCFINQRGDIVNRTEWWKQTSVSGTVNLKNEITFYASDYIARFSVILFVVMLVIFLVDL